MNADEAARLIESGAKLTPEQQNEVMRLLHSSRNPPMESSKLVTSLPVKDGPDTESQSDRERFSQPGGRD